MMMNFYPPFLFGRVRVKYVSDDFKQVKVRVKSSLLNTNLSRTMFGGTMFSAADPFYALMYWQNFAHQYQQKVRVWLKSAEIKYKKPAVGDMYLDFKISQEDVERVKLGLETKGKHNETHVVHLTDDQGDVCATVELVTYIGLP